MNSEEDIRLAKSKLDELLSIESISEYDNQQALSLIAEITDLSGDCNYLEGIERALELSDQLVDRSLSIQEASLLHYFQANAWAGRRKHDQNGPKSASSWEQPALVKELLHLRLALRHEGFKQLDNVRRCQILTNTANLLNTIGRFTEALEYWNRALRIMPKFGMALGNRGYGLVSYARTLYDSGHAILIMKFAHEDLLNATLPDAFYESSSYDSITAAMSQKAEEIAENIDLDAINASVDLHDHSMGHTMEERSYRGWCLKNRLFLSPLNDIGDYPIAAHDVLMLPSIVVDLSEPPTLLGFYNQLKQEYVSARFLFYEGTQIKGRHYSDRWVQLYDTLDYPAYSLAIERVKMAFRVLYSLFDKLAFFINAYWKIGLEERSVNFRTVWYAEKTNTGHNVLRDCFTGYENWPLRGLYWLSKDLFAKGTPLADTIEPDAEALNSIRNHLEHKYLKVHDWPGGAARYDDPVHDSLRDSLAYSMGRSNLEAKTLRLIKLSRAGLIYLSLAVHQEEKLRAKRRGDSLVMPMTLDTWPDDWKQ